MAYDYYDNTRRRSTYFPNVAENRGYSLSPRFTAGLQPSPTGSYYNPSRYAGEGFSPRQLNRIQQNLATTYMKDLEFNRIANPNYQTTQDTGYSSDAQFGSGRASPATVQRYAEKYGTPTGNGLVTFGTPSGGSITYRPSGRRLSGGAEPTVSPGSQIQVTPELANFDRRTAYAQGYGAPSTSIQQGPGGPYTVSGGVAAPYSPPGIYQSIRSGLQGIGTFAANLFGRGSQQQQQSQPMYAGNPNMYDQPNAIPYQPKRYDDYYR